MLFIVIAVAIAAIKNQKHQQKLEMDQFRSELEKSVDSYFESK